jgi:hypothetical protein
VVSHDTTLRTAPVDVALTDYMRADFQFSRNKNNHSRGCPMSERRERAAAAGADAGPILVWNGRVTRLRRAGDAPTPAESGASLPPGAPRVVPERSLPREPEPALYMPIA